MTTATKEGVGDPILDDRNGAPAGVVMEKLNILMNSKGVGMGVNRSYLARKANSVLEFLFRPLTYGIREAGQKHWL